MNPEQQASVAEFIGAAIKDSQFLNATTFSKAAGINPVLTAPEFAIVQSAHEQLRA